MHPECGRSIRIILISIVEQRILRKLSIATDLDILLPVKLMLLDPGLIEWIVVKIPVHLPFGHHCVDVGLDQILLLLQRIHLKQLLHSD